MNSVSFIFHTVKMTWPSFPQKSKYLQSVFKCIAGHKFFISIFWIENCDFILVVLWKNRVFCGSNGVFSDEKVSILSRKGCSSVTFCLCGCGPLASISLAQPTTVTVLPLLLQEYGQGGGSWQLQPGYWALPLEHSTDRVLIIASLCLLHCVFISLWVYHTYV